MFDPLCLCNLKFDFVSTCKLAFKAITYLYCTIVLKHYEIWQNFSVAEPSNEQKHNEDTENDVEIIEGKVDQWTPLNCLVEAANRTKSSKSNSQGPSLAKSEQANAHDSEVYMSETKARAESPSVLDNEQSPLF